MRQHSNSAKDPAEKVVKDIRRATRKQYSAEEKIRIVLEGLRGEDSIAELCRREGIAPNLYYQCGSSDNPTYRLFLERGGCGLGRVGTGHAPRTRETAARYSQLNGSHQAYLGGSGVQAYE